MNFIVKTFSQLELCELYNILKARSQIFIMENNMHCQDMDGADLECLHFYLHEKGEIAAYARGIYTDSDASAIKLGRVLSMRHKVGLGRELMEKTIQYIKDNTSAEKISLHSQKTAVGFYEKLGNTAVSDEFLEEGVIHIAMEMNL